MNKNLITFVFFLAEKTYFIQSYSLKNNNNHDDVNNINQEEKKCGVTNSKVLSSLFFIFIFNKNNHLIGKTYLKTVLQH